MALLDIFKKKKQKPVSTKVPTGTPVPSKPKKISGQAYGVLKRPHVTEKATDSTLKDQYIFEVFSGSNKNQVKKAIEDIYGVDVVSVNIVNIPRKRKRLGRIEGWSGGYKKAI